MKNKNLEFRFMVSALSYADIDIRFFEVYIYENSTYIESEIGIDHYFCLIGIDFKKDKAAEKVIDLVSSFESCFYTDLMIYVCCKLDCGFMSLADAFNALDVINEKIELPINTTGYSSEINRLGEDFYKEGAYQEIENLLSIVDIDGFVFSRFKEKIMCSQFRHD